MAHFDLIALLDQHLVDAPGRRGRHLDRAFFRLDLQQRLANRHGVSRLNLHVEDGNCLQPLRRQRHRDFDGHSYPPAGVRGPAPSLAHTSA